MTLTAARRVADAVLYEGYLLYPYRASSSKNQVRWQFGVLGPVGVPTTLGEGPCLQVECPVSLDPEQELLLTVHVRFLQVLDRRVQRLTAQGLVDVEELQVCGARWIPWQEATEREVTVADLPLTELCEGVSRPVEARGEQSHEDLYDGDALVGRLVRTWRPQSARLELSSRESPGGAVLQAQLTNLREWDGALSREEVARDSLVGTHLLMEVTGGRFVSLTDAPDHGCRNSRWWPVLITDDEGGDALLVSPIILSDHPEIAPESAGDLFDATEIDEILTLRIMTLTDDEKQAARGTDKRAAAIIDRSDAMSPAALERLHGAVRQAPDWWDPAVDAAVCPETDTVLVDGVLVGKGSRVRLRPRPGGDIQDMFVAGLTATVSGVYLDVDGGTHVAVTVDDDPGQDLHEWFGRFSYFRPDEVEPLS